MAKFNYREVTKKVAQSVSGQKRINTVIQGKFSQEKEIFIEEFKQHEVSREITGASSNADQSNISGTLPGSPGNLFGFIGFNSGDDPVTKVVEVLNEELILRTTGHTVGEKKILINCSIREPKDSIIAASPLPFESGKSWVYGIEKGISGFGHFITGSRKKSRSTMGLQVENTIRKQEFQTVDYLQKLLRNLTIRMKGRA